MSIDVTGPHRHEGRRCESILRSLPQWFGIEEAIVQYVKRIEDLDTFLAYPSDRAGGPIGFMSLSRHFEHAGELHVLAVRPEHHRRGVGCALLDATEAHCRALGIRYLQVKTLSPRRESEEYTRTRLFYLAMGFEPLEEFPTLWGTANPALQMIKKL